SKPKRCASCATRPARANCATISTTSRLPDRRSTRYHLHTAVQVWSFASSSDGNCYLVESEGTSLLVSCGPPYGQLRHFLGTAGPSPEELSGIVLTNAHGDHCRCGRYLSQTHRVPIYASRGTMGALILEDVSLGRPLDSGRTYPVGQLA